MQTLCVSAPAAVAAAAAGVGSQRCGWGTLKKAGQAHGNAYENNNISNALHINCTESIPDSSITALAALPPLGSNSPSDLPPDVAYSRECHGSD